MIQKLDIDKIESIETNEGEVATFFKRYKRKKKLERILND